MHCNPFRSAESNINTPEMTSADDSDVDDEGIEELKDTGACTNILELCRHHLAAKSEAESHYRAVCRFILFFNFK